jgi:ribosomal-protein-alanine N-acetyltransferase
MSFTVREATRADVVEVQGIELASYPDPWPRSLFHLMLGRAAHLFLVAEEHGAVVGYTIGEMERKGLHLVGHVMNVAVKEGDRRRGIGTALMDELEKRFAERGASTSYLEVRVKNDLARDLYKRRGYHEVGLLPSYYRGEDGIAMEKPLGATLL